MKWTVQPSEVAAIAKSEHQDPFSVLGMHSVEYDGDRAITVRANFLDVREAYVYVIAEDPLHAMERLPNTDFFEAVFTEHQEFFRYQLEIVTTDGERRRFYDVYSFLPVWCSTPQKPR